MSLIIFLIVLVLLIFVHELGHFLVAKRAGIRVDEFGLGFPPRAIGHKPKNSETLYSLNWLPIGGFVRIFGEDPTEEGALEGPDASRSLVAKPKMTQVAVLGAGVVCNVVLAWLLLALALMVGFPAARGSTLGPVEDVSVQVAEVLEGSPADRAGLGPASHIYSLERGETMLEGEALTVLAIQQTINVRSDEPVVLRYGQGERADIKSAELVPEANVEVGGFAVGIVLTETGIVTLPAHQALWQSAKLTYDLTGRVAVGLGLFIAEAVRGAADFSQIAGPVGLVGLVGEASARGIVSLITFAAIISLNLAIINLVPFPALDGGRILFIIIEAIKGSPIQPKVASITNMVGFVFLILLMLAVTFNDIVQLVVG